MGAFDAPFSKALQPVFVTHVASVAVGIAKSLAFSSAAIDYNLNKESTAFHQALLNSISSCETSCIMHLILPVLRDRNVF